MDRLTKLYVEITTTCNLNCQMCVRHVWQDLHGTMSRDTFARLMDQVRELPEPPVIHLGGYGEPMVHPDFLEFVRLAKQTGACVEMTTNGTMINRIIASALFDLKLDRLFVSIDGVLPDHYEDIRVGSSYTQVIENMRELWRIKMRRGSRTSPPRVGIAFVAMKRNIDDLSLLPALATSIGAQEIRVSNVVPHVPELEDEVLYHESLTSCAYRASHSVIELSLPKLDLDAHTVGPLREAFNRRASISLLNSSLSGRNDYCQFTQQGYAAVRWDGAVSPCLSLMHDHPEYVSGRRKDVTHHTFGNVRQRTLKDIWESPEFGAFRERVRAFPFSPCTTCGGCDDFAGNLVDCSGETFPVCGGCLWAQGFVQCP